MRREEFNLENRLQLNRRARQRRHYTARGAGIAEAFASVVRRACSVKRPRMARMRSRLILSGVRRRRTTLMRRPQLGNRMIGRHNGPRRALQLAMMRRSALEHDYRSGTLYGDRQGYEARQRNAQLAEHGVSLVHPRSDFSGKARRSIGLLLAP